MVMKLMMTIATLSLSQHLLNLYVDDEYIWYASSFVQLVTIFSVLCFLTAAISYRRLFLKTLSGLWCVAAGTDVLIYPLWFISSPLAEWSHVIQSSMSVAFFVYVSIKSYSRIESDPVESGYVYQVRAIPNGLQDMLLSVAYFRPFGGTGVIVDGKWYHYRKGRLQCDKIRMIPVNRCVIIRVRRELPDDKYLINQRIGERWSWIRNCATVLKPFSHRRPTR